MPPSFGAMNPSNPHLHATVLIPIISTFVTMNSSYMSQQNFQIWFLTQITTKLKKKKKYNTHQIFNNHHQTSKSNLVYTNLIQPVL